MRSSILAFLVVCSFCHLSFSQATLSKNELVLENDLIKKVIRFSSSRPSSVRPVSLVDKNTGKEMLASSGGVPWFEFVINEQLITSDDPYWQLDTHQVRKMGHGGEEIILRLLRKTGPVKGLEVSIIQQLFPGSTMIREQAVLRATDGASFTLNKHQGEHHLVFPGYRFKTDQQPAKGLEIKVASWSEELLDTAIHVNYDERGEADNRGERNLSRNYMYHPKKRSFKLSGDTTTIHKGPILLSASPQENQGWVMVYEHGSPDDDPEQDYLVIAHQKDKQGNALRVKVREGAYFEGESITSQQSYSTVWSALGIWSDSIWETGEALLYDYLFRWICEEPASRKPSYYYNTWGMQRDSQKPGEKEPREILTTEKVLEEIALASELGIKLFVLDDGWQHEFGDWTPHDQRFKNGLKPIADALDERNITFGIWMAPIYVDSSTSLYKEHSELAITDAQGQPVTGRWDKQAFCMVSEYQQHFIRMCKYLIDQGVRYFKWDGLDKYLCSSPLHHHGDAQQSPEERRKRYGFAFPLYITRALEELKAYEPEVVVEVDVTEPGRSVGLSFLSEGKYFWMNNGASAYGDYSTYRSKSIRMIPNLFHTFMPPVLQTYAAYPHNQPPYMAQHYHVNSSMIGGKGFWGNLNRMSQAQRQNVATLVHHYQQLDSLIAGQRTAVTGSVGASPETYTTINQEQAAGHIVAFSGSALSYVHALPVREENLLAVVNSAYYIQNDTLYVRFRFPMPDTSREAFLFPNQDTDIRIIASTGWLTEANVEGKRKLSFTAGGPGTHTVQWPEKMGKPQVTSSAPVEYDYYKDHLPGFYRLHITTSKANTKVALQWTEDN